MKVINVSAAIIEPLIALSIIFIAAENVFKAKLTRYRSTIIFVFGLLHGLGFASVLNSFGLPDTHFLWALIGFNIGVELGQITLVIITYFLLAYWFNNEKKYQVYVTIPGSLFVGFFGTWWLVERTFLT